VLRARRALPHRAGLHGSGAEILRRCARKRGNARNIKHKERGTHDEKEPYQESRNLTRVFETKLINPRENNNDFTEVCVCVLQVRARERTHAYAVSASSDTSMCVSHVAKRVRSRRGIPPLNPLIRSNATFSISPSLPISRQHKFERAGASCPLPTPCQRGNKYAQPALLHWCVCVWLHPTKMQPNHPPDHFGLQPPSRRPSPSLGAQSVENHEVTDEARVIHLLPRVQSL